MCPPHPERVAELALMLALTARAAEELRDQIDAMGKQKLSDVHAAQNTVTRIARELEDQGLLKRN